jgi:CheY-like chemotaxis protein
VKVGLAALLRAMPGRENGAIVSLTCLIVDDSPEFLRSAARLLKAEGMSAVATCLTGAEALEIVAAQAPDVVLIDVELGDEDGVEVARTVAAVVPVSRIILISSRDPGELRESLDRQGRPPSFLAKDAISVAAIADLIR